jgi:transcriptional regulator with XRE-family HTH domain
MRTTQADESTVGKRLKEERQRLNMSQDAFGKAGGVGKGAQINYEQDARSPDTAYLQGIDAVGADVLYVVTGHRRIDLATTPQERNLLQQAIAYVMQRTGPDVPALELIAPQVQARYDVTYEQAASTNAQHPGQAYDPRVEALIDNYKRSPPEGRKVIERIAEMESGRPASTGHGRATSIKGDGNIAGEHNKVTIGSINVKKR